MPDAILHMGVDQSTDLSEQHLGTGGAELTQTQLLGVRRFLDLAVAIGRAAYTLVKVHIVRSDTTPATAEIADFDLHFSHLSLPAPRRPLSSAW